MRKIVVIILVIFSSLFGKSTISTAQDMAATQHTQAIPKGEYKTWSLFLICNPRWMADDKAQDLTQLNKAFQAFGNTIGHDNLAVWFWKHQYQAATTTLDDVDLERSSKFCAAYNLAPSKGPYIVVTSTYPDDSHGLGKLPPNSAWFQLGSMKPAEISDLLAALADKLVANKPLGQGDGAQPATETVASWDVRLLGAAQQLLNRLGCAWTFKIEAEGVKAEMQSCTR